MKFLSIKETVFFTKKQRAPVNITSAPKHYSDLTFSMIVNTKSPTLINPYAAKPIRPKNAKNIIPVDICLTSLNECFLRSTKGGEKFTKNKEPRNIILRLLLLSYRNTHTCISSTSIFRFIEFKILTKFLSSASANLAIITSSSISLTLGFKILPRSRNV